MFPDFTSLDWLNDEKVGAAEMAVRAIVVYIMTIMLVRIARIRFMGKATAFDVIVGIMLGSIASRAITGNAPFWPAIGATAVLLMTHWLISWVTFKWHGAGILFKGTSRVLVRDGDIDWQAMTSSNISERDLTAAVRDAGILSINDVAEARIERSGELSVARKQSTDILDINIEDGVKTVRLLLKH